MIYIDLIVNLSLLVALSVVSSFIDNRWPRSTRLGVLLQGFLFGCASVIGMLRPLNLGSGLIFDGRSVMISLCALFFGPWAALVALLMTIPCRIGLGGVGMIMGVLVILSSAGIGLVAHFRLLQATKPPSTRYLFLFGLAVHLVMVALMFTLPGNISMSIVIRIGIPVILLYPLATILVGKILSDQLSAMSYVDSLRKSEEKFRFVFEAANVGKSLTLPTGEINVNQAFCDMLGYTSKELRKKRWQDITPAEDVEPTQTLLDQLLQRKKDSIRFDKRYIHKNGSTIWADVSVTIQRDIYPTSTFFITTVIDITERKLAEEMLQESERRLREVQEMAHLGSWNWDVKTGNVEWSEEVYKIFLLDPKEFTPHIDSILALSPWPEDNQRDKELINLATKTHAPGFYEQKFLRTDKSIGYYSSTFQGNYDVKGELISIVGTVMDITERKRAEEVLKESERQYRNLFENSMEGIFQTTPEGKLISANMAFTIMFGYESPEEIIRTVEDIAGQLYANAEERKKAVTILEEKGYLHDFECRMRRKDGTTFWTLINAKFAENQEGIRCFEGFIIDITERNQIEEKIIQLNVELEKQVLARTNDLRESQLALLNLVEDINSSAKIIASSNRTLETANKEIESFSYSVSHDLRAPLRSIDGFSQVLLEDYSNKIDDTGRNYLERIRNATQHMGQLIDDMLKLSRVTRAELIRESVDLSKMFREIAKSSQKNDPARIVDVIIQKDIIINGDRHLLEIVLTNLIDNAWKFTGKTKNARVELGSLITNGKPAMFIRDNGVGFDMTYLDKLFGTFQRLHTKDEFVGTGIGLATVKRIITRHGGEIWAEGEVGRGAVFYFTIP